MEFLSSLLQRRGPARERIQDFTFDPLDPEDYPAVRQVVLKDGPSLAWHQSVEATLERAQPETAPEEYAWLARDLLDGMVLDLQNRRATRANDLVLQHRDGQLRIRSLDTSSGALLRRLTRGRLAGGKRDAANLSDWKYVEFLRGQPEAVSEGKGYRGRVKNLQAGEIALMAEALPYLHCAELLMLLPEQLSATVFQALLPRRQMQVFAELSEPRQARLLDLLPPDVTVDFLALQGLSATRQILERMNNPRRRQVMELLEHPSLVAAGQMTNDIVALGAETRVDQAREQVREIKASFDAYIYLINSRGQLVGVTSRAQVFFCQNCEQTLAQLGSCYVNALRADEPAEAAAFQVLRSHLAGLPVVGPGGKLLGAFTNDAALKVVLPENLRSQVSRIFT